MRAAASTTSVLFLLRHSFFLFKILSRVCLLSTIPWETAFKVFLSILTIHHYSHCHTVVLKYLIIRTFYLIIMKNSEFVCVCVCGRGGGFFLVFFPWWKCASIGERNLICIVRVQFLVVSELVRCNSDWSQRAPEGFQGFSAIVFDDLFFHSFFDSCQKQHFICFHWELQFSNIVSGYWTWYDCDDKHIDIFNKSLTKCCSWTKWNSPEPHTQ